MPLQNQSKIRVLLIEDNPGDRDLVREYLSDEKLHHYELRMTDSIEEGLSVFEETTFDAVLVDLGLPDSCPDETVETLPTFSRKVATLIMTGSWNQQREKRALRHGAVNFLEKDLINSRRLHRSISLGIHRFEESKQLNLVKNAFEGAREGLFITSAENDYPIVKVNDATTDITGYTEDELIGQNPRILQCEETSDKNKDKMRRALNNKRAAGFKLKNKRKNGEVFWNYMSFAPVESAGQITHWVAAIRDITEEMETQHSLEHRNKRLQRYRTIFENTTDLISIKSASGEYRLVNKTLREKDPLFSDSKDGQQKAPAFVEPLNSDQRKALQKRENKDRKVLDSGDVDQTEEKIPLEEGLRHHLTTRIPIELEDDEPGLIRISTDITDLKRQKAQLEKLNERFRQVAENIDESFFLASPDFREFYFANSAVADLYGINIRELKENPVAWARHIRSEYLEAWGFDLPETRPFIEEPQEGTFEIDHPERGHRWLRARIKPVKSEEGGVKRVVAVTDDITERKEAQERLHQVDKMKAMGRMAGGLAHDFNNMISVIIGYANLIGDEVESEAARDDIDELLEVADEAQRLTKDLLEISQTDQQETKFVEPLKLIDNKGSMVQKALGDQIHFAIDKSNYKPTRVRMHPSSLNQIIMNLAINAKDAMQTGGTFRIKLQNQKLSPTKYPELEPGDYVRLMVSDTGDGIPESIQDRIFEPLFTTKQEDGSGIGLARCHALIKSAGGTIQLDESSPEGTTFSIFLPSAN